MMMVTDQHKDLKQKIEGNGIKSIKKAVNINVLNVDLRCKTKYDQGIIYMHIIQTGKQIYVMFPDNLLDSIRKSFIVR